MSIVSGFAIYFVIWWVVLFAILPIGVVTQDEQGRVEPGTVASAPIHAHLLRKAALTTVIALLLFAGYYWLRFHSGLTLDDIPIGPVSG